MKTYIADIIPKLQRFSQKLDNLTLLTNQHWVVLDELESSKTVFIFRSNNELLISRNGKVEKAKWEYLGNNSILIDQKETSHLFKQGFFDENVLALKVDSKDEYAFLVNENRYDGEINSVERATDFLSSVYLRNKIEPNLIPSNLQESDVPINIDDQSALLKNAHPNRRLFFIAPSCFCDYLHHDFYFKILTSMQVQSYFSSKTKNFHRIWKSKHHKN
jgi:hypothetical protein